MPRKPTLQNLQAANQQTFEGQKRWMIRKGGVWAGQLDDFYQTQFASPDARTLPFAQHAWASQGHAFNKTYEGNTRYVLVFKDGLLYNTSNAGAPVNENVDKHPEWLVWVRAELKR